MTRPSFETKIRASYSGSGSGVVDDALYAKEVVSGVSRRKPVGWLAPTNYSFLRDRYERHSGRYSYTYGINAPPTQQAVRVEGCWGGSGWENSLNVFNDIYSPRGVPSSMRDKALIKARLAMKDQDVNLGQAFAERNRTAELVGDTAISLAKSYRSLRRGDWRGAARALGLSDAKKPRGSSVPRKWLELQYGWKPLLSDVYGAVDALAKRDRSDWCVTGKGSVVERDDRSGVLGTVSSTNYGSYSLRSMRGVYVRIDAIPQNDLLRAMVSLGVTNPLQVGWELVPLSFVVDWFLPIGDYLSSLDAMLGYGPTWCSISEIEKFSIEHKSMNSRYSTSSRGTQYNHLYERIGHGSREYVRLVRTSSTSVPLPSLPRFKDPVSLGHMANGLSLLAQVFGHRR